jgi:hypothetical protein
VSTIRTFASLVVDSTLTDTLAQLAPLSANTTYYWRVSASNDSGASSYTTLASFATGDQIQAVEENDNVPAGFALEQNYPNPFNPTTTVRYFVGGVVAPSGAFSSGAEGPDANHVRLAVYDMLGREVAVLVNERKVPGTYQVNFDGAGLSSGVYLYRLTAGQYVESRRMVLLK